MDKFTKASRVAEQLREMRARARMNWRDGGPQGGGFGVASDRGYVHVGFHHRNEVVQFDPAEGAEAIFAKILLLL